MRSNRQERFHLITKGRRGVKKRTTVSIDGYISMAMAIKLGKTHGSSEAHTAIRQWLQELHDKNGWIDSYWSQKKMFEEVVERRIYKKMDEILESEEGYG